MKAAILNKYDKNGSELILKDIPIPECGEILFKIAGRKYDRMAAKKNQKYYFIFVHEDGAGLERISEIFAHRHIVASVDEVFGLDDVNKALKKVAAGKSKGKTIMKIYEPLPNAEK